MVAAVPALLSLGLLIDEGWLPILGVIDAAVIAIASADAVFSRPRRHELLATTTMPRTWSLGRAETVQCELANTGSLARSVTWTPDVPREVTVEDAQREVVLPPRSRLGDSFQVTPRRRGTFHLGALHVAVTSRLGLWRHRALLGAGSDIHVYPNLKQLGDYALLARTNRLSLIGVRACRRAGGDTDFERLRDWHSDDSPGRVDWKATARRDLLTVREYQVTQSQNLVLLIDAGRMMVSRAGGDAGGNSQGAPETDALGAHLAGSSLLDQAIDSALLMAHVALMQGDRVGLIAYADSILRYVPVAGGPRQLNRLIHALHDLHPRLVESRHEDAFLHLRRHERKRSLVTVFTHVLDEVNAAHLERHCTDLVGRHLPLVVMLRDADLHAPLGAAPADAAGFWRAGAAAHLVAQRAEVLNRLSRAGALTIDAPAERLTPDLVSQYLRVKARHLL